MVESGARGVSAPGFVEASGNGEARVFEKVVSSRRFVYCTQIGWTMGVVLVGGKVFTRCISAMRAVYCTQRWWVVVSMVGPKNRWLVAKVPLVVVVVVV